MSFFNVLLLLCFISFAAKVDARADPLFRVVATTPLVGELVEKVAGTAVHLDVIVPANLDPHTYKLRPADVRRLNDAHLIFYSGLNLEAEMESVFRNLARKKIVRAVSADIPKNQLISEPDSIDNFDPHFWHDIKLWRTALKTARDALILVDRKNERLFLQNAASFDTELDALEKEMITNLEVIPKTRRVLVTIHDAFSYFARSFNFQIENIQGINTVSSASISDLRRVVDVVIKNRIPAIFVENTTSSKNAQSVIDAARDKGWKLKLGGTLFADGPGKKGTPSGSYCGMMRVNADAIIAALVERKSESPKSLK